MEFRRVLFRFGAELHDRSAWAGSVTTSGATPAAAASRASSSRRAWSLVMINGFVMQPRVPATHGVVPDDSRTCGQPRRAGCLWTKSGARDPGRGQDVTVQDLRKIGRAHV